MVLESNLTYIPKMKEIKKEEQIIELINDVMVDIGMLKFPGREHDIKSILNYIESGAYNVLNNQGNNIHYSVDLSKAQRLIQDYRTKSEGGCQSCRHRIYHKHSGDEGIEYCSLVESEESMKGYVEQDMIRSPIIEVNYEEGCEDRKPIFSKTIEQLLE